MDRQIGREEFDTRFARHADELKWLFMEIYDDGPYMIRRSRGYAPLPVSLLRLADMESSIRQLMAGRLAENKTCINETGRRMGEAMHKKQSDRRHELSLLAERLKGVSPLEKLTQGYSYVSDEKGRNIRDVSLLERGDSINIYMLNGKVKAEVMEAEESGLYRIQDF